MRLFPMLAVILSISSSESSLRLNSIVGVSHPGCAPSARRQCLHFALQASVMKYTMYTGMAFFFHTTFFP